jgi:hypothetical protein
VALSEAELEWVKQAVAQAPPLTPERRERLRTILSVCASAPPSPAAAPQHDRGGAVDAA